MCEFLVKLEKYVRQMGGALWCVTPVQLCTAVQESKRFDCSSFGNHFKFYIHRVYSSEFARIVCIDLELMVSTEDNVQDKRMYSKKSVGYVVSISGWEKCFF